MNACRREVSRSATRICVCPGRRRTSQRSSSSAWVRASARRRWPLRRLAHDELERLVTPEEHLLRVAVRARVGELALEAKEDAEPALVADRGDVGRDAHEVDGAVDGLPGPEEHALTEVVVGPRRSREVHGQVGDRRGAAPGRHRRRCRRCSGRRRGPGRPSRATRTRGRARPPSDALAEVEVDAIGHVPASERPLVALQGGKTGSSGWRDKRMGVRWWRRPRGARSDEDPVRPLSSGEEHPCAGRFRDSSTPI